MRGFGFGFGFTGGRAPAKGYDPDAASLMSRMTATLSVADKNAINQFFVTMKADGTFGQCDCIYFTAGLNAADGLLNWRQNAYNLVNDAATPNTFRTRRGYTGLANTVTRLSSGFNPATAVSPKYGTSAFIASYVPTSQAPTNRPPAGGGDASGVTYIHPYYTSDSTIRGQVNSATTTAYAVPTAVGLSSACRLANNDLRTYKDGVKLGANTTVATVAVPNNEFYVSGYNNLGIPQGSTYQVAFTAWGGGLTDAQQVTLYNAVSAYLTYLWAKYETETWDYLDQIASDVQQQTAYGSSSYGDWYDTDWIKPLKAKGIWQKGDKAHILANYDAQAAQRNAIKPLGPLAPVNAPTFTKDRGYAGNATSSYLNDNVAASTMMVKGTRYKNSIAAYVNTSRTTGQNAYCLWSSNSAHHLYPLLAAGPSMRTRNNDATAGTNLAMAVPDAKGFTMGNRLDDTGIRYVKNGVLHDFIAAATTGTFTSQAHYLGALSNGSPTHYDNDRAAFVWSGDAMDTPQQELDFYNIVQAALTKIGAQAP